MIPNIILADTFEFDEQYVLNQIENSYLDGAICGRIEGFRVAKLTCGYKILAWQCNKADVQYNDVELPTIITIFIDDDNCVKSIELHSSFKGSQGITCSQRFLKERLEKVLLGESFCLTNKKIRDELALFCRHVYELVLGSCSFLEYCKKKELTEAYVSESIMTYHSDEVIETIDRISVNGEEQITKIEISNYLNNIDFGLGGEIERIDGFHITGFHYEDGMWVQEEETGVLQASTREEVLMKLMKIVSRYWMNCAMYLSIKKNFYFSILYPTSFFGIFTQSFALTVFNKNYAYFQHCINGLQRVNEVPLCIGTIKDIDEGMKVFEGFKEEYLY